MKRFLTLLIALTAAGLFYVSMEVGAVKTGYTIRKQEEIKVQLLDRGRALKYNIARLKAPHNLERKLTAQKILLAQPREWQTLVMGGAPKARPDSRSLNPLNQAPYFLKFFLGTAQAEAKDSR